MHDAVCYAYRVNVDQRNAGKTSYQCDELVEIVCTDPSERRADADHEEAEKVLLPFDIRVVLAGSVEG